MIKPYYDAGGVTIYHGDCRDVLAELEEPVDVVLTDPPYASGARRDAERQVRGSMDRMTEDEDWFSHDAMTSWGFTWFIRSVFTGLRGRLPEGAHLYLFTDWRQTPNLYGMLEACGYRVNQCLVWDKTVLGMGAYWRNQHEHVVFASNGQPAAMRDRGAPSVLQARAVLPASRVHPTEKPEGLLQRILRAAPAGTVLDPFCGSGPSLAAAKALGQRAIGIELEERYCEVAAKRAAQTMALPTKAGSSGGSQMPLIAPTEPEAA